MLSLLPRHRDWRLCLAHSSSPISLPRTGGQVGLCNVVFEDCSAFTHVTACTLAKSPSDPLHQRLQPFRYLHDCSDCFRLEQYCRVGFAPTEKRRLCTAHARMRHSRFYEEGLSCSTNRHSVYSTECLRCSITRCSRHAISASENGHNLSSGTEVSFWGMI